MSDEVELLQEREQINRRMQGLVEGTVDKGAGKTYDELLHRRQQIDEQLTRRYGSIDALLEGGEEIASKQGTGLDCAYESDEPCPPSLRCAPGMRCPKHAKLARDKHPDPRSEQVVARLYSPTTPTPIDAWISENISRVKGREYEA